VVAAFDNMPSRRAVADAAAALGIACLHIALGGAGDYGCGLWDDDYLKEIRDWRLEIGDRSSNLHDGCDYPLTRPLALLVAAGGAEALVGYLLDGERRGFEVTLRDLRMGPAREP
jgi:hypothetical protein